LNEIRLKTFEKLHLFSSTIQHFKCLKTKIIFKHFAGLENEAKKFQVSRTFQDEWILGTLYIATKLLVAEEQVRVLTNLAK